MTSTLSRREIFEVWAQTDKTGRKSAILELIVEKYYLQELSEPAKKKLNLAIADLCFKIEARWLKSNRLRNRFLSANLAWLDQHYMLPVLIQSELQSTSSSTVNVEQPKKPGRIPKKFEDCSEKTKKRRVQNLLHTKSPEEIRMANEMMLHKMGKRDSAKLVKDLLIGSSSRGTEVKKLVKRFTFEASTSTISPDEALAIIIDANLSTHQYDVIRQKANQKVKDLFPSYEQVKQAKKNCYPGPIEVTEVYAKNELQSLVNHTIQRLCLAQRDVLFSLDELRSGDNEVNILVKWGCDGAQQKQYKQKFSSQQNQQSQTDESIFSISMVPIQMYLNHVRGRKVIWQNPAPSSTRYCRPIKFIFAKETSDLISQEVNFVEQQITALSPTVINDQEMHFKVKPLFLLTMIDGKICTTLSSVTTSSQTCFICGAKPKEMNNLSAISNKVVDKRSLSFGLSPLHSWIRFMECVLHIAYRLDVKAWQVRGAENKAKVAASKKHIQEQFRSDLGLLIDMPTQNAGNTNDGNTARRFFRSAKKSSQITEVNLELIVQFHIILETLGSGYAVDEASFHKYVVETRELYLKEYPWYPMPVSVHKVLFHGKEVIANCILPIGQLSEEAQEARNKDMRKYKELFTRKTSRVDTNIDLLNRLLISSDPFIASLRYVPKRSRCITREVLSLLSAHNLDKDAFSDSESD